MGYHIHYLKYLMEHGVVGLFVFLGFLYAVTRRVVDCDHPRKNVMIGWLAFLFVAGLSSTIGDTHLFWIVLGIVIGAGSLASPSVWSQAFLGYWVWVGYSYPGCLAPWRLQGRCGGS